MDVAVGGLVGVDEEFAQEARGEAVEQGLALPHARERGARQAVKLGHGIGKGGGLEPAALEQGAIGDRAPACCRARRRLQEPSGNQVLFEVRF